MKRHGAKLPLIYRLPLGLREQPAWVFIGSLIFLVGVGYVTGFTESLIAQAIGSTGLKVWGGILALSGGLLVVATVMARPSLEKLSLRAVSCTLLAYAGYLLTVVSFKQASMTFVLTILLIGLAEFRVLHLKALMKRLPLLTQSDGMSDE